MPVSTLPFGEALVFGSMRSRHAPARHHAGSAASSHLRTARAPQQGMMAEAGAAADASAQLSSQFYAVLCASRFAHTLKMLGRLMVGSNSSADDIERKLQRWLSG